MSKFFFNNTALFANSDTHWLHNSVLFLKSHHSNISCYLPRNTSYIYDLIIWNRFKSSDFIKGYIDDIDIADGIVEKMELCVLNYKIINSKSSRCSKRDYGCVS